MDPENSGNWHQLTYARAPECFMVLGGAGIGGLSRLSQVYLAGSQWHLFRGSSKSVGYSLPTDRFSYIFYLGLPEELSDEQVTETKGWCQQAAEAVIDTFAVVEE